MHSTSKGYRRFRSRVKYFQEDLEAAMVICKNGELLSGDEHIFQNISPKNQPCLFRRQNSQQSRVLVLNHMRNTLYIAFIKELYEEVMIYLSYAINCATLAMNDPTRLIGSQNNLQFNIKDILNKGTKEDIFRMISDRIFRTIENKRDTLELVTTFNDRLSLEIPENVIDDAMPYLEMRHLFVHNDGIADEHYRTLYPNIHLDNENYILLNAKVIKKARTAICALVSEYDSRLKQSNCFERNQFD